MEISQREPRGVVRQLSLGPKVEPRSPKAERWRGCVRLELQEQGRGGGPPRHLRRTLQITLKI